MNWEALTAIGTTIYVFLVVVTLVAVFFQLREQKRNRTLQVALAIFEEWQTKEARMARRYVYQNVPSTVEGVSEIQRREYLDRIDEAVAAFDRIGYLLRHKYIDPTPIIAMSWPAIWRCWRKCTHLISWAREVRGDPTYLESFEYLYELSEVHRLERGYKEPKFY